jgi:hypothetical protein
MHIRNLKTFERSEMSERKVPWDIDVTWNRDKPLEYENARDIYLEDMAMWMSHDWEALDCCSCDKCEAFRTILVYADKWNDHLLSQKTPETPTDASKEDDHARIIRSPSSAHDTVHR